MRFHLSFVVLAAVLFALHPRPAFSHCDTLDGPVVKDARTALETRDVTPVLKWVAADNEGEIRQAFAHALAVRGLGAEARSLADRFFFETLVRVHRQGEGAPYTGLQPAGAEVEPGIAASDRALETGSVDTLVALAAREVEQGPAGHGVDQSPDGPSALPSSRSHRTELATAPQRSQSPKPNAVVENACCRNGM